MVKKKSAASKAVRQAEKSLKTIRQRSKQLLKSAEIDVREYRKQLTVLKHQNIISKKIDTRSHQPTRYMLRKLKKFKAVALGHEIAIPASKISPHRARQYIEKGMARQIGGFITRPKSAAKQKLKVYKDHIQTTTELRRGEEDVVLFPTHIHDMHDVVEWLAANEEMINETKGAKGQLGFQLAGHNSRVGLANVRELIKYLHKYDGSDPRLRGNIFGKGSAQIAAEFVIIKFRPDRGVKPKMEPYYGVKRYSRQKDRKDERRGDEYRREKERKRKARQRFAESAEAYELRLEKQRERDRANANARREERMAKRLLGD